LIDVRRATPADARAIESLVELAYARYVERMGMRPAPMDVDYAVEIAEREVWVAPRERPPVGVLVVHPEADHLFVHNVAVDPAQQGRGLGKALLGLAERRAEELGLCELRLLTNELMTENRAIYAHLGWEETEVRSEHGYRRAYFRKRLGDAMEACAIRCER
jgi:N-acetylglutamate synthase-like GNAT family acetyltransferase